MHSPPQAANTQTLGLQEHTSGGDTEQKALYPPKNINITLEDCSPGKVAPFTKANWKSSQCLKQKNMHKHIIIR